MRRYFRGEIRLKRGTRLQGRAVHSWVPGSNHELDGQQQPQVSLVPTAVNSNLVCKSKNVIHPPLSNTTFAIAYIRSVHASIVNRV